MKKVLLLSLSLVLSLAGANLFGNTVIVKGTIKDSANRAVANKTVKIYSTDSTNNGCLLSHTVLTNPNGYYIDTVNCNGDIRKLVIIVESCGGIKISRELIPNSTNILESNFILCETTPNIPLACKAAFSYQSTPAGLRFNGAGAIFSSGDSIISRIWSFGDSTVELGGNQVDPLHAYAKPGIYNACLTIKTKSGCSSSFCQQVVYTPASNDCQIQPVLNFEKLAAKKIRLLSALSATLPGDSIIQRIWKFGDGSSLDGNEASPLKEFKDSGSYTICLSIRTAKGCEKQICINVLLRDSLANPLPAPLTCKSYFTFAITGKTVKFNSNSSVFAAGDSIISRNWFFGDSSAQLSGNRIDPSYTYGKAGTYTVCLYTKTRNGCESKICQDFIIRDSIPAIPPANCKAVFAFQVKDSTVYFNSKESSPSVIPGAVSDSIISRSWYFMDNTSGSVSLGGNIIDPAHKYLKPGTYNVYLVIKTKNGCESKYTLPVTISTPPVPVNCKAQFVFTAQGTKLFFNSANIGLPTGDSVIARTWIFGDTSAQLTGNRIDPSHVYPKSDKYTACLYIKTKAGCESKYCMDIVVKDTVPPSTGCKAQFTVTIRDSMVQFNSAGSVGSSATDSIISRSWYYSDSSTSVSLTGNIISPSYKYTKPGTYQVYLLIRTKNGCENKFAGTVIIPQPVNTPSCKAVFSFTQQNGLVNFNSTGSKAASAGDSIVSRFWVFGDSTQTTVLQGNQLNPTHTYTRSGKYTVTLYIKTANGCESKYYATVNITTANCPVEVNFSAERVTLKKVQFNSSQSKAQTGDSIIQRNWKFGDNTILSGNEISPLKEFPLLGVYNTCLQVRTLNGCEAQECKKTVVQDTANIPPATVEYIKILSINPNPVVTRMVTTILSRTNNVEAEISVFDIYGTRKLTVKKILFQGNNIIEVNTEILNHGPYFLQVSAKSGKDTKAFYKL